MNKKIVFLVLGILALAASVVMYRMGRSSANLSELKQFWWVPLPLGFLCFMAAGASKKQG